MRPEEIDVRIRAEQIRSIYQNTPPGLLATFIAVGILSVGLVYIQAAELYRSLTVTAIMIVQTGARLLLHRAYMQAPGRQDWRRWAFWFTVGTCVGGFTIGTGSIWMIAPGQVGLQIVALLIVTACTSGAVSAFGAYLPAFYVFFVAISIAPLLWLFSQRDAVHIAIGIMYSFWVIAVAEQARRSSSDFIASIRLRFDNLDLVEDLRSEKAVAEEANAAKSRFLAAASHDLRQPVHALSLFVAALRPHQMDTEARGLLDHIDASVRSMGGLFGGLLDISRLDAGVVEVNRAPFVVQTLLERVANEFEQQAKAKGVELRVRSTREVAYSDPMLFERILRNIVANAVSYTDRGKILIGSRRGPKLRVQVLDTGRGIAARDQQQVFQEFYQVGNPERDRTKGVGLGLAIVKRLTTLLGHQLQLASTPGKGTCFTIEVPYATAEVAANVPSGDLSGTFVALGTGLILVVDDEVAIQIAMKSLLSSWGYSVIAAGSYAEILDRVATHREIPRLIVCDYRLRNNETGSDVIERLRSEYNDEIPGLLITGDTAPDRLKEAQASGYLLLHKPVPNSKLRAAITHLIKADVVRTA